MNDSSTILLLNESPAAINNPSNVLLVDDNDDCCSESSMQSEIDELEDELDLLEKQLEDLIARENALSSLESDGKIMPSKDTSSSHYDDIMLLKEQPNPCVKKSNHINRDETSTTSTAKTQRSNSISSSSSSSSDSILEDNDEGSATDDEINCSVLRDKNDGMRIESEMEIFDHFLEGLCTREDVLSGFNNYVDSIANTEEEESNKVADLLEDYFIDLSYKEEIRDAFMEFEHNYNKMKNNNTNATIQRDSDLSRKSMEEEQEERRRSSLGNAFLAHRSHIRLQSLMCRYWDEKKKNCDYGTTHYCHYKRFVMYTHDEEMTNEEIIGAIKTRGEIIRTRMTKFEPLQDGMMITDDLDDQNPRRKKSSIIKPNKYLNSQQQLLLLSSSHHAGNDDDDNAMKLKDEDNSEEESNSFDDQRKSSIKSVFSMIHSVAATAQDDDDDMERATNVDASESTTTENYGGCDEENLYAASAVALVMQAAFSGYDVEAATIAIQAMARRYLTRQWVLEFMDDMEYEDMGIEVPDDDDDDDDDCSILFIYDDNNDNDDDDDHNKEEEDCCLTDKGMQQQRFHLKDVLLAVS